MRVASLLGVLLLWPMVAEARRVVLLDFAGDQGGRVREQLQTSLLQTGRLRVVSREELEKAVSLHNGYLGWTIKVEDARPVARELGAGTIITGTVGDALEIQLFDSTGEPLWTKRLTLSEKRLTDEQLQRLTAAVGVAARVGRRRANGDTDPETKPRRVMGKRKPPSDAAPTARWSEREVVDLTRRAVLMRAAAEPEKAVEKPSEESLKVEAERQAALAEINAAKEAARKRRQEARALEEQARAIARAEAEREEAAKRAAKIEKRLQEAAERYRAEVAKDEADLAREREALAARQAEAQRRREEISRHVKEMAAQKTPDPSPPPRVEQVAEAPVGAGRR